jgi:hypothetical protein
VSRLIALALFAGALGATCPKRSSGPPQPVVRDAGVAAQGRSWIPPTEVIVPAGFVAEFVGSSPLARRLMPDFGEPGDARADEVRVVGRLNGQPCGFSFGPNGRRSLPSPQSAACAVDPEEVGVSMSLLPMLWGRTLEQDILAFSGIGADRIWAVDPAQLSLLTALLKLPDVAEFGPQSLAWVRFADGTGIGMELRFAKSPMVALSRYDLALRFGGPRAYRNDVKAWGAHDQFHWVLRLEGGGAGVAIDGLVVRVGIVSGKEWSVSLERLLSGLPEGPQDLTVPNFSALTVEPVEGRGLRLSLDRSPLPAALLLVHLARRLVDFAPSVEEKR